jgi:hypothetical protein
VYGQLRDAPTEAREAVESGRREVGGSGVVVDREDRGEQTALPADGRSDEPIHTEVGRLPSA